MNTYYVYIEQDDGLVEWIYENIPYIKTSNQDSSDTTVGSLIWLKFSNSEIEMEFKLKFDNQMFCKSWGLIT